MKKITVLIIGLLFLLVTINVNAQSGAATRQQEAPLPNGECDNATLDFRIRYEFDGGNYSWPYPRATIKVLYPSTSVPENLLTTHDGTLSASLTIDAAAFNNLDECYTLDNVTVQIDVSRDFNGDGIKTKYLTGTKTLRDIFYYDYTVQNGNMHKTVNVRMQSLPNLTEE